MTHANRTFPRLSATLLTLLATSCVVGEDGPIGADTKLTAPAGERPTFRIVYAAGVNNPEFGDDAPAGSSAYQRTVATREALEGWVRAEVAAGRLASGFAGAPMTLVGNRGDGIPDGVFGLRDERAVDTVVAALAEFRRDGVDNVLVVSHSNGVITTQAAYTRFVDSLGEDAAPDMCIHFHHTQAAGSQLSDFVPLQRSYFDGSKGVIPSFRFTYNREDWMTYDPYRVSTVGRFESAPWVERATELAGAIAVQDVHHEDADGGGGGGHDQVRTLQDLTTPSVLAGYETEIGDVLIATCGS